jgi:hypothetical protein
MLDVLSLCCSWGGGTKEDDSENVVGPLPIYSLLSVFPGMSGGIVRPRQIDVIYWQPKWGTTPHSIE